MPSSWRQVEAVVMLPRRYPIRTFTFITKLFLLYLQLTLSNKLRMENRPRLTRHGAGVVGADSFNLLKLCGQTYLQLQKGTVPFSSFFFYFRSGA
jgi:hypothetical protein